MKLDTNNRHIAEGFQGHSEVKGRDHSEMKCTFSVEGYPITHPLTAVLLLSVRRRHTDRRRGVEAGFFLE